MAQPKIYELMENTDDYRIHIDTSSVDSFNKYKVVEYYRKGTDKLFLRTTLSGGTAPQYTTLICQYYLEDGTSLKKTVIWTLSYSGAGQNPVDFTPVVS